MTRFAPRPDACYHPVSGFPWAPLAVAVALFSAASWAWAHFHAAIGAILLTLVAAAAALVLGMAALIIRSVLRERRVAKMARREVAAAMAAVAATPDPALAEPQVRDVLERVDAQVRQLKGGATVYVLYPQEERRDAS